MKNRYHIFFIIVLFLLSSCMLFQTRKVKDIDVRVTGVKLESLGKKGVKLKVKLHVSNPNGFSVTFSRIESEIYADDIYVGKAVSPEGVVIDDESDHDFTVSVEYRDLANVLSDFSPKKKINCRLESTLYFQMPEVFKDLPDYKTKVVVEKELPSLNELIVKKLF